MKTINVFAAIIAFLFLLQPEQIAFTQPVTPAVSKEAENKQLKKSLDITADSILKALNAAVDNRTRKPKTKTKLVYVYLTPDGKAVDKNCDTVYYVIKKKNPLQRLFSRAKADTIRLE